MVVMGQRDESRMPPHTRIVARFVPSTSKGRPSEQRLSPEALS